MMQEALARNYRCIPAGRLVPRMRMRSIVKIVLGMLVRVVVHIAEIDVELVILILDNRVQDLNPLALVAFHLVKRRSGAFSPVNGTRRWFTEEFTMSRRRRREDDAGHKPGGWDFT